MPSPNDKRSGSTHREAARLKIMTPSSSSSPADAERPPTRPTRSTRHAKPAFDVVRDAAEDTRTGWVYRSDTRPAAPPASAPTIAPRARFVPSLPPRSGVALVAKPKIAPAAPPPLTWVAGAVA